MMNTAIALQLGATGRCVCPGFLSPLLTGALRTDLLRIQGEGGFFGAGAGQGADYRKHETVRRDEIYWLDETHPNPTQSQLWERLSLLKQAFNRSLYLGLLAFEGHYAAYPVDGFYKRHRDSFLRDDSRTVSIIIYLNPAWTSKDGGQLRLYENGSHVDIDPVEGTLVCFLSRELEHEVLPSHAPRISFTGWFKA